MYNGLAFLLDTVSFGDVGVAIIILTIIVKLILFPVSKNAVRTQLIMKKLEPKLQAIREKYADDRQTQMQKTMELHRQNKINPLSNILLIFIQLPIIIALYWVFARGGLPTIDTSILYSFIPVPQMPSMHFLGLIDMSGKSAFLALLTGITQFYQVKFTLPPPKKRSEQSSLKEDLTHSFHLQMRYVMPVFIAVFAYIISAAVALYWITSNMFAIGQELVIRKHVRSKFEQ